MRSFTIGAAALAATLALSGAAFAQAGSAATGNSNTQMKGQSMTQGGMGAQMGEDLAAPRATGTTARGVARSGEMGEMRSSTRSKGQMGAASRSQKARASQRRAADRETTGSVRSGQEMQDMGGSGSMGATGMGSGRR
jgi:hypothetical protein